MRRLLLILLISTVIIYSFSSLGFLIKFNVDLTPKKSSIFSYKKVYNLLDLYTFDYLFSLIASIACPFFLGSSFCFFVFYGRFKKYSQLQLGRLSITIGIVLILIFVAHLSGLIISARKILAKEENSNENLENTLKEINQYQYVPGGESLPPGDLYEKCDALNFVSKSYECCGLTGVESFTTGFENECCSTSDNGVIFQDGCRQKLIDLVKSNIFLIMGLNSLMVLTEFLSCVIYILLIIELVRENKKDNSIELSTIKLN